jgi:hypothetical protein
MRSRVRWHMKRLCRGIRREQRNNRCVCSSVSAEQTSTSAFRTADHVCSVGLEFWHVTLKFHRASVVAGLKTSNMNLSCGWDFSYAGTYVVELIRCAWNSSEWDLSSGVVVEPWAQAHNTLGEPQMNLSPAELMSVEGDTFSCNISPAPLVS